MQDLRIETKEFHGDVAGKNVLVFGGIHGNEPCGPEAVGRLIAKLESGQIRMDSGSITFVQRANPEALASKTRYVEEDLNRVFRHTENPGSYEASVANILCDLVDQTDMLLDIHSTGADGPTSVFIDFPTPQNTLLANKLGADYALLGWPTLYENNPHGFDSFDTTRYAFETGVGGVLIECGQHDKPESVDFAEEAILRTMIHFDQIDDTQFGLLPTVSPQAIRMTVLGKKENDGDRFEKEWTHLERISEGTLVATRANGDQIRTEKDSVMLLPKHAARAGQEWFYLGILK